MKRRSRRSKQRQKRQNNSLPFTNAEINHLELYLDKFKLTNNELKWLNKQLNIAENIYFNKIWESQQKQMKNNKK